METKLTNDADYLMCQMYKHYLERRNAGTDKGDAIHFGSAARIKQLLGLEWSENDVAETCWELSRSGLLSTFDASDTVCESHITSDGIVYMESRFARKLGKVLDRIEQLKRIIF